MDIEGLVRDHLYAAIVIGSLIEGETTVVLAGYAAHQGYAPWWVVTVLAAGLNFVLDQSWYLLGRWRAADMLRRFAVLQRAVESLTPRLQQHRRWVVFTVRFVYGLRTAGPITLGIVRVPWREFCTFNALGAVAWAATFAGLGYVFGRAVAAVILDFARYEGRAVVAIMAGAGAMWLWRRHRRQNKHPPT